MNQEDNTNPKLNIPPIDPDGWKDADLEFLNDIVSKVNSGKIQLYVPSSLINKDVFDSLSLEQQSKTDQNAFDMLGKIREIMRLYERSGEDPTYQMINLIEALRLHKERLESEKDIFVI